MYGAPVGDTRVTAAAELYTAGKPVRLFNVHIISDGTAGVTTFYNGGAGGTAYIKVTGTINTGATTDFGINGKLFPSGCYVSPTANALSTLCSWIAEL